MKETDYYDLLQKALQIEYYSKGFDAGVYTNKQFRNVNGKKHALKPDFVIFHNIKFINPLNNKQEIFSPEGLEDKHAGSFCNITEGVLNQITKKYANETFLLKTTEETFTLNSLAFATTSSCSSGYIYEKNFKEAGNFFIERMCWRANVIVLLKQKDKYWFSFKNHYYTIDGLEHNWIGQGGVRID